MNFSSPVTASFIIALANVPPSRVMVSFWTFTSYTKSTPSIGRSRPAILKMWCGILNNGNKGNVGVQVLANLSAYGAVGGTINGNVYANLNTGNSFAIGTSGWNVQSNSYGPTVGTKNSNAAGAANSIGRVTE